MTMFTREFTPTEINLIGPDLHRKINKLIDSFISINIKTNDTTTTTSRVLALINDTPMSAVDVLDAYLAVYGPMYPLNMNYTRFVINDLYSTGMIKRVGHGQYVRETEV